MKIIFVLESFCMGGVERVTFQLLCGLRTFYSDIEFIVVYEQADGEYYNQYKEKFSCRELQGRGILSRKATFNKILECESPDIVVYTKGGLSKYRPFRRGKVKHLAIQHVPIDLPETNVIKNIIRQLGASFLYRRLDKVICVSKGIKNNLENKLKLNSNLLTSIYNPVLDLSINESANQLVEYNNYFICVGRLDYQKGYDLLLDIVTKDDIINDSSQIIILGDGPQLENIQQQIYKLGLDNKVILHGTTTNPYKYIKNAKAILLPSRWEGLPTVLVEAAYLNTQIITFDCRYGPKELTNNGENGYLIEMGNTKLFSRAMKIVSDGEGKTPPSVKSFTLEAAVANYVHLFESLK
jgi:glycosyltransferase involved in cell wall biosynthesis